ncbi:MAG: hypothetical protein ACP5M9_01125 [Candidatus Micrarchaeia archaeon]
MVYVNKQFKNIRSYRVIKSVKNNTNFLSRKVMSFVDKRILKKESI